MSSGIMDVLSALPPQYPGLLAFDRNTIYLGGCSSFDQFCCTWRGLVEPSTYCAFCVEELHRRGRKTSGIADRWIVLANEFPRPDVDAMYLIVPNRHLTDASELSSTDWSNIGVLFEHCRSQLGCKNGALVARYGDPRYHAGTIEHFHMNVIVPMPERGMSIPLAKHLDGERQHRWYYTKLLEHRNMLVERGGVEWLFSREGVEETQPKMAA